MNEPDSAVIANSADQNATEVSAVANVQLLQVRKAWHWISGREWVWRMMLYCLLGAPLFLSGPIPQSKASLSVVWPRIHSGDEPHYLVMLNSLIQDGDLDLANNYASVHSGGIDAGQSFAGQPLDHHVSWYADGKYTIWWQVFDNNPARWTKDSSGKPQPTLRRDRLTAPTPTREHSWHPPGIAFLLFLPAYPFRGTVAVESIAILCTVIATILASFFFEKLVDPLVQNWQQRMLVTGVTFLGTPIWHYGRTLFNEPYLLCFGIAAFALVLRYDRHFWAGVCIGLGILMKPPFALLVIPLVLHCVSRRKITSLIILGLPLVASVGVLFWMNLQMHGSISASSTEWQWGNQLRGSFKLLFSFQHGILPFAPMAIIVMVMLPRFFEKHFPESMLFLAAFVLYFGLMVSWISWHGGYCFGPRMILPVLPFFFLPLCSFFDSPLARSSAGSQCAAYLAISSVVFNAIGAFGCGWVWNRHPAELIADWFVGMS